MPRYRCAIVAIGAILIASTPLGALAADPTAAPTAVVSLAGVVTYFFFTKAAADTPSTGRSGK
jgi:hypothetical protein